jgi:hypothetical protein
MAESFWELANDARVDAIHFQQELERTTKLARLAEEAGEYGPAALYRRAAELAEESTRLLITGAETIEGMADHG